MPCYARPAALILAVAIVITMTWTHASAGVPPALILLLASAATLAVLGWITLLVRRDRAGRGVCTGCRLACQQPAVRPEPGDSGPLPWPQPGTRNLLAVTGQREKGQP